MRRAVQEEMLRRLELHKTTASNGESCAEEGGHDERWTRGKVDMLRLKQEEKWT